MKYYSSHEFFEEGRKEGENQKQNSIIRKMLSMNQSPEFISQCTEQPVEYIQQIAKEEPMLVREESSYNKEKD